jgi:hypothetical protein
MTIDMINIIDVPQQWPAFYPHEGLHCKGIIMVTKINQSHVVEALERGRCQLLSGWAATLPSHSSYRPWAAAQAATVPHFSAMLFRNPPKS